MVTMALYSVCGHGTLIQDGIQAGSWKRIERANINHTQTQMEAVPQTTNSLYVTYLKIMSPSQT